MGSWWLQFADEGLRPARAFIRTQVIHGAQRFSTGLSVLRESLGELVGGKTGGKN